MGHRPKLGSYGKNLIFWPKTKILGQKKAVTFGDSPCSGHDRKKLFKEKKCLCPNNQGGKCPFFSFNNFFRSWPEHGEFEKVTPFFWAKISVFGPKIRFLPYDPNFGQ